MAGNRGQVVDQQVEKYEREPLDDLATVTSGDLIEVELEIDSKNDYEYLLFEDMKAAGFEPVEVRSGYTATGMGAYMELRDHRVTFFVRHVGARQTQRLLPPAGRNSRHVQRSARPSARACTHRNCAATPTRSSCRSPISATC